MKKAIGSFLIFILITTWFSLGWPQVWQNPQIPPKIETIKAASQIIRPNGDSLKQWNSTATDHWTEIDEVVTQPTAGTITDYIDNTGSSSTVDRLQMETIAEASSVSGITVWVYGSCTNKNSVMSVDIYYTGGSNLGTVQFGGAKTWSWQNASFTGLTLTQAQLDSLQIEISGDSGGRTYTVATLYADVTYSTAVSISLNTDGSVGFGTIALNSTQDTTVSGINDPETVSVDSGPADLDIRSTTFTEGANTWTLGTTNGSNQVKWEFSKNGTEWITFAIADTLYSLDTNVAQSQTRDVYLRITMPTATDSYSQYNTTVTIVASAP